MRRSGTVLSGLIALAATAIGVAPAFAAAPIPGHCREFHDKVTIDGARQSVSGMACHRPDGSWQLVPTPGRNVPLNSPLANAGSRPDAYPSYVYYPGYTAPTYADFGLGTGWGPGPYRNPGWRNPGWRMPGGDFTYGFAFWPQFGEDVFEHDRNLRGRHGGWR